mgnify:CR=1 FL=1|jgi:hypothetical protein
MDEPLNMRKIRHAIYLIARSQGLISAAEADSADYSITSEPFAKRSFRPNSALCSKFYPRYINYMPVVKFLACLDFERKS